MAIENIKLDNDLILEEPRWISGEFHNHSCVSLDVSEPYMTLENILKYAFRDGEDELPAEALAISKNSQSYDFLLTADHFRNSPRDVNCMPKKSAVWEAMAEQAKKYNVLKSQGRFQAKAYYPAFEWDMPGLDHGTVALMTDGVELPIDKIRAFEWLFCSFTSSELFDPDIEQELGPRRNERKSLKRSFEALEWIKEHCPNSFLSLNHPSAKNSQPNEVNIEHIRRLHDIAPDIFYSFEGIPGNQFSGDRGEYPGICGGADPMLATVGGIWDALLSEGRRIFVVTSSDFHFKISSNGLYSSGYWPSEYARTYLYAKGENMMEIVHSLRSGNAFVVTGDLIQSLEFTVSSEGQSSAMGGELKTEAGEELSIMIQFKESEINNYQANLPEKSRSTNHPQLDHIDLIAGPIRDPHPDPSNNGSPETHVLHSFPREEWEALEDGSYQILFKCKIQDSMYFRLRGSNLAANTPGETDASGNPLPDEIFEKANYQDLKQLHHHINERNYKDLWFYSNPIFVYI